MHTKGRIIKWLSKCPHDVFSCLCFEQMLSEHTEWARLCLEPGNLEYIIWGPCPQVVWLHSGERDKSLASKQTFQFEVPWREYNRTPWEGQGERERGLSQKGVSWKKWDLFCDLSNRRNLVIHCWGKRKACHPQGKWADVEEKLVPIAHLLRGENYAWPGSKGSPGDHTSNVYLWGHTSAQQHGQWKS